MTMKLYSISVLLLPQYYLSSISLCMIIKGLKDAVQSKADEIKKSNSSYSGPLYITFNEVKRAFKAFLKEVES